MTTPPRDLTAERAAIALLEQMGLYGHPAASQFIGDILVALKAARQEALREARQLVSAMFDQQASELPDYYAALLDVGNALDRLASEGG
jgi:hypothetical protein